MLYIYEYIIIYYIYKNILNYILKLGKHSFNLFERGCGGNVSHNSTGCFNTEQNGFFLKRKINYIMGPEMLFREEYTLLVALKINYFYILLYFSQNTDKYSRLMYHKTFYVSKIVISSRRNLTENMRKKETAKKNMCRESSISVSVLFHPFVVSLAAPFSIVSLVDRSQARDSCWCLVNIRETTIGNPKEFVTLDPAEKRKLFQTSIHVCEVRLKL